MRVEKGVILTAGEGKRMYPLTVTTPKALLPIGMKTAVQLVAEEMIDAGVREIAVVVATASPVRRFMEFLTDNNRLKNVQFTFLEQEKPLGSGHALSVAKAFCGKENFFLANCDDLFENNACKIMAETGGNCVGLVRVPKKDCGKYGITTLSDGFVKAVKEKPADCRDGRPLAVAGRYLFDRRIFDCLTRTGFVGGEQRLTDAVNLLCALDRVNGVEIKGRRFDVGCAEGYMKAFICMGRDKKVDRKERMY